MAELAWGTDQELVTPTLFLTFGVFRCFHMKNGRDRRVGHSLCPRGT